MSRHPGVFAIAILGFLSLAPVSVAAPAAPQTMSAGDVLRGHFVQARQLQGFAKPLKSEGSFVLAPGRGLIWHSEKPFDNTAIITAGGILQLANGREAMRLSASKLPGLAQLYNVLSAALSGNTEPLKQTFAVTQSANDDGWKVELKPLDSGKQAMSQIKRLVLTGSRYVEGVEVERTGGDVDRITFSGHKITKADLTPGEVSQLKAAAK
jgi:hypothetical protein